MTFNNPRAQERDNQNALRKFPFSDAASCENGTCVIVPGAIIDAQLYVPGRSGGSVWMSEIDTNGILHFSDESGEFAETTTAAAPMSAVPVTFTGDGGPLPGGVIVFGAAADVSALLTAGGQAFSKNQAELVPAAVTWLGLPGVSGFKLDDGHVVSGAVRFRGKNGCDVSTYASGGTNYLRISAVGHSVETVVTTGFITKVVAESDNKNFVVALDDKSSRVIDVTATGVSAAQTETTFADQETACGSVRTRIGSVPSPRAYAENACDVCKSNQTHTITLMNGTVQVGDSPITWFDGTALGNILPGLIPEAPAGKRFLGYFDSDGTMYYRYDGTGVGRFTAGKNVIVYARWMASSSQATVTFDGYGTLHLAAADIPMAYSNPIIISGCERPVPAVSEVSDDDLTAGSADELATIVLHPNVPSGEVHIGIRGLNKVYAL